MIWSDATDRRIKEDTSREVSVTPLCEGSLFLEVSLDCREILLLKHIVNLLISRLEVLVLLIVDCIVSTCTLH